MIALASAPLGCIGKEPSLPADDKGADGVFNLVAADFNLTMLKKRAEVRFLIIGAFGRRFQPLPAHVRPASRTLCVLNLVVAAVSIRNQNAAEALKEIPGGYLLAGEDHPSLNRILYTFYAYRLYMRTYVLYNVPSD